MLNLFQGLDTKVIALDVDGAGQVDFLCRTNSGYELLPWGLGITDCELFVILKVETQGTKIYNSLNFQISYEHAF